MLTRTIITFAIALLSASATNAACPASVAVGSPDAPIELGNSLKGDPDFAKMHLANINRLLPRVRQSCQEGIAGNCRLASFLATAKSGLECHAGVSSSVDDPANSTTQSQNFGTPRTQAETCKCGSDYVPCLTREARRSGSRYQVSADGRSIVYINANGSWGAKKGLNADGTCSAVVN